MGLERREVSFMKPRLRDLFATLLVAAALAPYLGYVVTGRWPSSIGDFGGMAFVGLLLATSALWLQTTGDRLDRVARLEEGLMAGVVVLGVAALVLSETAAAQALLAVFMGSILVVWMISTADHAELTHWHDPARPVGA
jgi:hypothetical protein